MRCRRPFDFNTRQINVLDGIVSRYYFSTRDNMPVYGAWRSMGGEEQWKYLIRIIVAIGRSAPSYRLVGSPDFERLTIAAMKAFEMEHSADELIKMTHSVLAKYGARYCSPKKETSLKARVIVQNLNEPLVVDGTSFVLLRNMHVAKDPRFYLTEHVHGYGMKSASEFLTEIGYSQEYMAFDSRLKRVFSLVFDRDFDLIRTPQDYIEYEEVFRDEICPELGIKPSELDAIVFWNYGDILKSLKPLVK